MTWWSRREKIKIKKKRERKGEKDQETKCEGEKGDKAQRARRSIVEGFRHQDQPTNEETTPSKVLID